MSGIAINQYVDYMIDRARKALQDEMTPPDIARKARKLVHVYDVGNPMSCYVRSFAKQLQELQNMMDHPEEPELF